MEPDMCEIDPRDCENGWADTEQNVRDGLYRPSFRPMRDRGRETSNALVEVRTVLSRAETALDTIRRSRESWRDPDVEPYHGASDEDFYEDFLPRAYIYYEDEDKDEMLAALEHVVESLEWWRRTGRLRKEKP